MIREKNISEQMKIIGVKQVSVCECVHSPKAAASGPSGLRPLCSRDDQTVVEESGR